MITYYKKTKPEPINVILPKVLESKKHCAHEWQDRAFEIADKLDINLKKTRLIGSWLKLFKLAYSKGKETKLDQCYSFLSDYSRDLSSEGKIKMFFWRYNNELTK